MRRLREERKLSLRELAELLKADGRPMLPSALSKIETGERRVDVDDLDALALALGSTPHELMGWKPRGRRPTRRERAREFRADPEKAYQTFKLLRETNPSAFDGMFKTTAETIRALDLASGTYAIQAQKMYEQFAATIAATNETFDRMAKSQAGLWASFLDRLPADIDTIRKLAEQYPDGAEEIEGDEAKDSQSVMLMANDESPDANGQPPGRRSIEASAERGGVSDA